MRLAVVPAAANYLSLRLWGGEKVDGNLTLICDGKQVGDRLLSDYDQLDYGAKAQQFTGAFYYRTYRLPDAVTRGKTNIDCTIEASGPIFSYAETFDKFQQVMTSPSRPLRCLRPRSGMARCTCKRERWATDVRSAPSGRGQDWARGCGERGTLQDQTSSREYRSGSATRTTAAWAARDPVSCAVPPQELVAPGATRASSPRS